MPSLGREPIVSDQRCECDTNLPGALPIEPNRYCAQPRSGDRADGRVYQCPFNGGAWAAYGPIIGFVKRVEGIGTHTRVRRRDAPT